MTANREWVMVPRAILMVEANRLRYRADETIGLGPKQGDAGAQMVHTAETLERLAAAPQERDAVSGEHIATLRDIRDTYGVMAESHEGEPQGADADKSYRALDAAILALSITRDAGRVDEAAIISLVAGPYMHHHKMDEHAMREGKAFDRCRDLTIQNVRTYFSTRRAMDSASDALAIPQGQGRDMGEMSDGYHTFNELYAHRVRLFSQLMHAHSDKAWWSRQHDDGSKWDGWIVAGIDTPAGPATYHLPETEIPNLPAGTETERGKPWDGHTAADVLDRLLSLVGAVPQDQGWADDVLPCDVIVAPATRIRKGCKVSVLLSCIDSRRGPNQLPDADDEAVAKVLRDVRDGFYSDAAHKAQEGGEAVAWMKPDGSDVVLTRDLTERWKSVYTVPLCTRPASDAKEEVGLVGELVEMGDDEEGNPRLVISATREAIRDCGLPMFRSVQVSCIGIRPASDVGVAAGLYDKMHGTPCAQIRWQQERDDLLARIQAAEMDANRYQVLRSRSVTIFETTPEEFDRHADAALSQQKGNG